jgi:hypothetical protein
LIHAYITHVSKEDFFSTFVIAFRTIITESNVRSGFRATGLVLYDLDYMISQLDVRLRTPILALTLPTIWEPKTPQNTLELQSQSTYLKDYIIRYQNSSLTTIL